MELYVIPRTVEVATNEVALERALVTVVVGIRPDLTLFDVQDYIMGHFGVEPGLFMVHLPYLEVFLVLFRDVDVMMWVLNAQCHWALSESSSGVVRTGQARPRWIFTSRLDWLGCPPTSGS